MISLAITFTTKHIEFVALTGTKSDPTLLEKGKLNLDSDQSVTQNVAWFETQLDLLLSRLSPAIITYRLTVNNVTNKYVFNVFYGQSILNLICFNKEIKILPVSPASITAGKFGQERGDDLFDYLENLIGKQPRPWDKGMKNTALMALMHLK